MFARDWNIATARQVIGTSEWLASRSWLPKALRTEGLNAKQWEGLKHENRMYVVRSIIGAAISTNMIQMAMQAANGKTPRPIWENESGHYHDIDTGLNDNDGRPIYLRNWLYRQVDDYVRAIFTKDIAEVGLGKMEPLIATTIRVAMKEPSQPGQAALWGERAGYTTAESLANIAKEFLSIMPYKEFQGLAGYGDKELTLIEKVAPLIGTSARKGWSRDVVTSDMLKDFYFYLGRHDRVSKETLMEISKLRNQGKMEEADKMVAENMLNGTISKGQYESLILKHEAPILGRILSSQGAPRRRFVDFLQTVPPSKRDQYIEHLGKLKD
jgi:hypothetical protein